MRKYFLYLTTCIILTGFICPSAWANREGYERHEEEEYHEKHKDRDDDDEHHGEYKHRDDDHHEREHKHRNDDHHEEYEHREGHEYREKQEYHDRRFYKSRRISDTKAREIVKDSFAQWQVGEGWQWTKSKGVELIIPLEYKGQIIGEIKVNPVTGDIMAEKAGSGQKEAGVSVAQARKIVQKAIPRMNIGDKIRLGKRGNYWEVPLVFKGIELEEIKVGTGTGRILPDWHIEEEAYYYRHR